ncbi:MAG: site-specific DNA-methyltransferase [Sulfuricaulis sp.]|uniref:site-specific DNA-methyltransferase n=1 Tax=Sulfuricaulis sp. TaxID=2003553 RepID=UPI0025D1A0B2|nr:site-specific DNA-methyltransferase [Sulfuricaulis sp.]MCR4346281.1 site-specific DNA-methyltransferase [Sulfuricaulis sp.]
MATPREKFQELLKKLFQFDNAELDFGIYRIMNHKRAVIEQFIETDLVKGIATELASGALAQEAGLAQQLAEVTAQIKENIGDEVLDAEGNLAAEYHGSKLGKQYLALRERAGKSKATPELEADIFNHLYAFFSRYYDEGDFMSLRRYSKRDKYAIPYNGEEVHLHWANADQYYIKTGENFTDYSYKHGGWTVHFKLRNADVEQNNVKGAKRFFVPRAAEVSLDEKSSTLTIPFEFRPLNASEEISYGKGNGTEENGNGKTKTKKKKGQEGILADASAAIQNAAKKNANALAALLHEKRRDADGNPVSLLEHHLRTYTRVNSTDFFIHKDLKGFLERELDFYLKNEVLNLDELEAGGEARSESWFQTLRAIKGIGHKIIAFVAQIENFQKRLFEKKKFVTEVHYCVTLDRVSEELYPEIAKNKAQIGEWKRLFYIHEIKGDLATQGFKEPVKVEFLKANPFLVLDTQFFSAEFKAKLLASGEILSGAKTLEEAIDGLLIHSENFQALNLVIPRYAGQANCIYIDPPYNTNSSEILYKNGYKSSTWITLINNSLPLARAMLRYDGILCATIDDEQQKELATLLSRVFGSDNILGTVCIRMNPSGRITLKGFAQAHEYAIFAGQSHESAIAKLPRTDAQLQRFNQSDGKGSFEWRNFRREGSSSERGSRPRRYFPIYVKGAAIRIPKLRWQENTRSYDILEKPNRDEVVIYPIDAKSSERVWRWGLERVQRELSEVVPKKNPQGELQLYYKYRPNEEGVLPTTVWVDKKYSATEYGTATLKDLFGSRNEFSFPKSIHAVEDCVKISVPDNDDALIVDYFGGSGTTGHAAINLNREDGGKRKYVLVEVGDYFNTVTKPRIQKVIYSEDWKDGKPVSRQGSSHAFKYLRLESYEDALNNITFEAADAQTIFQLEDYILSYMLDFETKASETLLNVAKLDAPFDYKLRCHGKDEPMPVDLPETFNYLIGLHVAWRRVYENKGTRYLVYRGTADGRETAILWRTTRGWKQEQFEADRDFVAKQKLTEGAEDILVNTDSFIEGARSLDPVFKRRMFN